jgi:hypothetical protein
LGELGGWAKSPKQLPIGGYGIIC